MTPPGRRLKFAIVVMVSQMLLIALAIAWVVHMVLIAVNGGIYFIEGNPWILYMEIAATTLITLFATAVFTLQLYRLGERRKGDRASDNQRQRTNTTRTGRKSAKEYVRGRNRSIEEEVDSTLERMGQR